MNCERSFPIVSNAPPNKHDPLTSLSVKLDNHMFQLFHRFCPCLPFVQTRHCYIPPVRVGRFLWPSCRQIRPFALENTQVGWDMSMLVLCQFLFDNNFRFDLGLSALSKKVQFPKRQLTINDEKWPFLLFSSPRNPVSKEHNTWRDWRCVNCRSSRRNYKICWRSWIHDDRARWRGRYRISISFALERCRGQSKDRRFSPRWHVQERSFWRSYRCTGCRLCIDRLSCCWGLKHRRRCGPDLKPAEILPPPTAEQFWLLGCG